MYRSCSKISPAREALRVRLEIATACPDSRALALRNSTRPYGANRKVTAGGTCLDSTRPDPTNAIRLCDERCFAVGPDPWRPDGPSRWTWSEAAQLPLGGLTRGTRTNQRVDGFFTAATGSAPQPRLGTNADTVALPQVAAGTALPPSRRRFPLMRGRCPGPADSPFRAQGPDSRGRCVQQRESSLASAGGPTDAIAINCALGVCAAEPLLRLHHTISSSSDCLGTLHMVR